MILIIIFIIKLVIMVVITVYFRVSSLNREGENKMMHVNRFLINFGLVVFLFMLGACASTPEPTNTTLAEENIPYGTDSYSIDRWGTRAGEKGREAWNNRD
jgi:hypothetical protein